MVSVICFNTTGNPKKVAPEFDLPTRVTSIVDNDNNGTLSVRRHEGHDDQPTQLIHIE